MLATVEPFPKYKYPSQLTTIRDEVLKTLMNTGHTNEYRKIARCKGSYLQCHSAYCPSCLRGRGHKRNGRILEACDNVSDNHANHLKFGTFKAKDVPLEALRETSKALMLATRQTFTSLGVTDYISRLEVSFESWSDLYHPHIHAIIKTPVGGRSFIPGTAWQGGWLRALPDHLHPSKGGAHIKPVRDLVATTMYMTKSPYSAYIKAQEHAEVARTVVTIRETVGLQKLNFRGSLNNPAHCATAA
jgi:hypothetical protein